MSPPISPKSRSSEVIKYGFLKGFGIGLGLFASSLFAAATAMNVFSAGESLSSSKINLNFSISAPEGLISAFYLDSCPPGWAPADGTNGTPDLRGLFVRGRDNVGTGAAGNDPSGSRAIGSLQADAFQGHRHSQNLGSVINTATGGGEAVGGGTFQQFALVIGDPITDGTNGTPRTSSESRPKNVALTYCMRKN